MTGLTRLAGMWSRDPDFLAWMEHLSGAPATPDDAAELIRLACKIESRRELDTNTAAAATFNYSIRGPFMAWRQSQREEQTV